MHEGNGRKVQDEPLDGTITRITIDGMPCLVWENKRGSGNTQYGFSGLTCDWSSR